MNNLCEKWVGEWDRGAWVRKRGEEVKGGLGNISTVIYRQNHPCMNAHSSLLLLFLNSCTYVMKVAVWLQGLVWKTLHLAGLHTRGSTVEGNGREGGEGGGGCSVSFCPRWVSAHCRYPGRVGHYATTSKDLCFDNLCKTELFTLTLIISKYWNNKYGTIRVTIVTRTFII